MDSLQDKVAVDGRCGSLLWTVTVIDLWFKEYNAAFISPLFTQMNNSKKNLDHPTFPLDLRGNILFTK